MDKFDLLNDKVDVLGEKLDKAVDRLISIDKTLVINTEQLSYHIKRTTLLEESLDKLRNDVEPVEKHVDRINFLMKIGPVILDYIEAELRDTTKDQSL